MGFLEQWENDRKKFKTATLKESNAKKTKTKERKPSRRGVKK